MCLRWDAALQRSERLWQLPEGVRVAGPPPQRFGVSIQRVGPDTYAARLLWDRTCFVWLSLTRAELMNSDLAPLLAALGTDLWYLLDQPIELAPLNPPRAA